MKKLAILMMLSVVVYACSQGQKEGASGQSGQAVTKSAEEYDPTRGLGDYDNVELGDKLDVEMAKEGRLVSDLKCASCHKYTDERLVGPGWAGVTERHRPEWLMNFVTNPDPMIDVDPELQAQLELCLVRMPNQNLSHDEARSILEFMRENDGVE